MALSQTSNPVNVPAETGTSRRTTCHLATAVPIGRPLRIVAALAGFGMLSLLVVAGLLRPDSRGLGTHEQLGLPPCAWQLVWNVPCPSCGMTTSWSCLMRGDVWGSLRANPGGTWAALMVLTLSAGLIHSAWRKRWSVLVAMPVIWTVLIVVQGVLMVVFWIARISG